MLRQVEQSVINKWNFDIDEYGEVLLTDKSAKVIADVLYEKNSVVVGMTPNRFTHYDVIFTYNEVKSPNVGKGLVMANLFISVIGFGAFGFMVYPKVDMLTSADYYSEKLGISMDESIHLTTGFFNLVRQELLKNKIQGEGK